MNKFLIVCGPTATGKTSLAANLAKKFNGVLISADSRQVYKGMDIVTGKDKPEDITVNGYDLVQPDQAFSVAHFVSFALPLLKKTFADHRLPIIVGGTGLYISSLVNPPATLTVPPDYRLRQKLSQKTVTSLQQQLKKINPKRFMQMNHSDQQNSRRLIRAIEVGRSQPAPVLTLGKQNVLWIGLTSAKKNLDKRIKQRLKQRLKAGAVSEWQQLRKKYSVLLPSMSAIGYHHLPDEIKWLRAEQQYARRQLTWFKAKPFINWFDVAKPGYPLTVVNLVRSWYTNQ